MDRDESIVTRFDGAFGPIAVATRSGLEESLHHGAAVALDERGGLRAGVGDPDVVVYPRSSLKPLQAHAMVELGLDLDGPLLAVACASHDGAPRHLDAVRSILERFGFDENDLANSPGRPYGEAERDLARSAGVAPSALQHNCSGKHAAMLATCRINGWDTQTYLDVDHPLQRAITACLGDLGCSVRHVGVDGCGAPTHAVPLRQLAGAYARLATARGPVAVAMAEHPDLVAGSARDVTLWMKALPGLIAKEGAQGVMAASTSDGRAFAFKIADGCDRARRAVVPQALRAIGVDIDTLAPSTTTEVAVPVLGHGALVGMLDPLDWASCSS
jgi:L-asparaginase II